MRILNERTLLILVLSAAAVVRLIGMGWSLPHTYEEATRWAESKKRARISAACRRESRTVS